ncbi:MAG: glycosyltransferase, partial [Tsuneonella sp.]
MTNPVFFDPSGRRRRFVGRGALGLVAALLIAAAAFAVTIVNVPSEQPIAFAREREQPLPLRAHLAALRHRLPRLPAGGDAGARVWAFEVPWDPESAASLSKHFNAIDDLAAGDALIDPASGKLKAVADPKLHAILAAHAHRPRTWLTIQNAANAQWQSAAMVRLLASPAGRAQLAASALAAVQANHWHGALFDIEGLPPGAIRDYAAFIAEAHRIFARAGRELAVTVPVADINWPLARLARSADALVVMDYDEHSLGSDPGPIASRAWFAGELATARRQIPAAKLVVALGSYAYDFHDGDADGLTLPEAWLAAHDSDAVPSFDPASGNTAFAYDDNGHRHTVWMLDAAATWDELRRAGKVGGVALWRLGSEDPGVWSDFAAMRAGRRPALSVIPGVGGTDVEGTGEILRIAATPSAGRRTVTFGPGGAVTAERYAALPTPFAVERTGAVPHEVALTFDDGPDETWTPQILSVLERYHAPATFFVVGENSVMHPELLRRIAADGDLIGNHSYTHPNMALESHLGAELELNATQRVIEAYTGLSTRLFRAPYFGDAEPTTADELGPALLAQQHGYTNVGLHVDSEDWQRPGVQTILDNTARALAKADPDRSENVILLHDGGGDRAQTVAALPRLITELRERGYRIVPLTELIGVPRAAAMPRVAGPDLLSVRTDVALFLLLAGLDWLIRFIFFFAIALGIARAVLLTALALMDRSAPPAGEPVRPKVSVIVPAYNEERVIVASIARVLASDYGEFQVIVADDGSKDRTSALVAEHFGRDPRVLLLTMANGGKAAAINRALQHATGEVIIALDADTQFLPDAIAKLVRWFADPLIGAVAGNARVGNTVNLVTRWQAIEYVTAQNVERRALDSLRAITVVPGAIGAWRRAALDAVGGYPEDTLAEDQDLTIAIQRAGWRVAYDVEAIALTEAPETFAALARQRFRWSFGTLQCLWKHRAALRTGRPVGLARIGMPQAWLFQIVFAALSPIIDLALVISFAGTALRIWQHGWAQTQSDVLRMLTYWLVFVLVDVIAGW